MSPASFRAPGDRPPQLFCPRFAAGESAPRAALWLPIHPPARLVSRGDTARTCQSFIPPSQGGSAARRPPLPALKSGHARCHPEEQPRALRSESPRPEGSVHKHPRRLSHGLTGTSSTIRASGRLLFPGGPSGRRASHPPTPQVATGGHPPYIPPSSAPLHPFPSGASRPGFTPGRATFRTTRTS